MTKTEQLFHRQVHPNFVVEDKISVQVFSISSQVFKPMGDDNGMLSTYNNNFFSPREAFEHFLKNPNVKSAGVCSVSRGECTAINLEVIDDNKPFQGHSSIDMTALSKREIKVKSKELRDFAQNRGWTHRP